MSFEDLKNNKQKFIEKLEKQITQTNKPKNYDNADPRFWKLKTDDDGNGRATIRFLPGSVEDDLAFIPMWEHYIRGEGGFYRNKSLTSLGRNVKDPVTELNSILWETENESLRKIASSRKRQLFYLSNVLVERDPLNPEAEGKVFLYRYGVKIKRKIDEAMFPPEGFEDEKFNPFDMWEGRSFKLIARTVEVTGYNGKKQKFPNYDLSTWENEKPIADNDEAIRDIYDKQYPLSEELTEEAIGTYAELDAQLKKVLGPEYDWIKNGEFDKLLGNKGKTQTKAKVKEEKKPEKIIDDEIPFMDDDEEVDIDELLKDVS